MCVTFLTTTSTYYFSRFSPHCPMLICSCVKYYKHKTETEYIYILYIYKKHLPRMIKVFFPFVLCFMQGPQGEPGPPGQQGLPGPHVSSSCFFFYLSLYPSLLSLLILAILPYQAFHLSLDNSLPLIATVCPFYTACLPPVYGEQIEKLLPPVFTIKLFADKRFFSSSFHSLLCKSQPCSGTFHKTETLND